MAGPQARRHNQDDLLKFKQGIRMHEKADFSDLERGMVVGEEGLELQKLLICCDFPTQASLGFMENGLKKRNHPLSSSFLGENALWCHFCQLIT